MTKHEKECLRDMEMSAYIKYMKADDNMTENLNYCRGYHHAMNDVLTLFSIIPLGEPKDD